MINIEVGKSIPLVLQVFDKRSDLKVTAKLVDNFGIHIATKELTSFGDGLYMNQSIEMPDVKFIVAQYFVEPDDYEVSSDQFFAIPKPSEPDKFIVGQVESRIKSNEYVIGVITNET